MAMKKKILTTSMAASLVLTSAAALPLSAYATTTDYVETAQSQFTVSADQVKAIYDKLLPEEKATLKGIQDSIANLNDPKLLTDTALWTKLSAEINKDPSLDLLTADNLFSFFTDLSSIATFTEFKGTWTTNQAVLDQLNQLANSTGSQNITKQSVKDFANAYITKAHVKITTMTNDKKLELLSRSGKEAFAKAVYDETVADSSLSLSVWLKSDKVKITFDDLYGLYSSYTAKVDSAHTAEELGALALIRYETKLTTSAVSGNGLAQNVALTFANDVNLLPYVTFEGLPDGVSFDGSKFVSTSGGTKTSKIMAKVKHTDKVIFVKDVTLTFTSSSSSGGGLPGDSNTGGTINKDQAIATLGQVTDKLADLLKENKGNGLGKARAAIQDALRKLTVVDLANTVKEENGVAKPALDLEKLADLFATIGDISKTANEKLKEAAPGAKPAKVIATLDFGSVSAATTEISLSKDLIAKAKENGIEAVSVAVNGVSLTIDLDQLPADTSITFQKKGQADASAAGKNKVVSDVYEFSFKSNGKELNGFSKPVEVRIPLTTTVGVDKELLVFAKVDDGKLVLKGGSYNATTKEFVAQNKSFSTYAIIENKIGFSDIGSVKDWAGRQIDVAAAKGILEGRGDGQFAPNAKVTRAEFAKMLVKAFGVEDAAATESFADVQDGDWFKPYVAAAVKAGLIQGRSAGEFAPNATITRAEMATMAARALEKLKDYKAVAKTEDALASFKDAADINSTLVQTVALASEQGIVVGEAGKFNPNNDSTRAQAAVVIYRLLNK